MVFCAPPICRGSPWLKRYFQKLFAAKFLVIGWVLAFLDVAPLAPGHTLLIPKQAVASVDQLSDESGAALGRVLPRLCRAVMQVSGCKDYNILQNNGAMAHQAVFHVHFHIIPKPNQETGLGVGWKPGTLDGGAQMAQDMRDVLVNAASGED
jgi:histidine triad (HIT) family protein